MIQRSPEWFAARKGRITGSRVGAILGVSPFNTEADVLREMVREHHGAEREFEGNVATQWGTEHESEGINWIESDQAVIVKEHGLVVHPEFDWLAYSPDGTAGNVLVEVKCPYSKKIPDEVPGHYLAQVQLGMSVMGLEVCHFVYWTPNDQKLFKVKRDPVWLELNFDDLFAFHQRYLEEIDNPTHLEPLVTDMTSDMDWAELERQYLITKKEADTIAAQLDKLKNEMIIKAGKRSAKGNRYQLIKATRPGSIANAKLYKELNITDDVLDKYRGISTEYFSIKESKCK